MLRSIRGVNRFALLAIAAVVYVVVGRLSLQLASTNPSASPVWPPTGIALALVLLMSARIWPALFAGAFLVNLATAGNLLTSLSIACGNTLEAVIGGMLVWRLAGGHDALMRTRHLFRFVLLAALSATTISATLGVGSLTLAGFIDPGQWTTVWLTWWLGDASGALVVAPLVLAWAARDLPPLRWPAFSEAVLLAVMLVLVAEIVFGGLFALTAPGVPLEFLCVPLLLWAAMRFGQRGAATATAGLTALAVAGTVQGFGPFAGHQSDVSLLLLQAYLAVLAITALVVAAVVGERREVEGRLRHLAISDPLTGLANYRLLVDRIHAEIARSKRTGHPFAILFMDLDGLKSINDSLGHVVGNRALLRVGRALKDCCRRVDLAARFGGDEFVVVMPESNGASAEVLQRRIAERLTRDLERPSITVTIGSAIHPLDGDSPEDLLKCADARLYASRRRVRGPPSLDLAHQESPIERTR